MNFVKVLIMGVVAYLGFFLALVLSPLLVLLLAWAGLSLFGAVLMFFFWLFIAHTPITLRGAFILLAWGVVPNVACWLLGYYSDQIKARRRQPLLALRHDTRW